MAEEMLPITKFLGYEKALSVGDIVDYEDYVFAVSSIGKVASAMTLTKVLERHDIAWIINVWLAGSLSPHLTYGDVVLVENTVEHDGFIEGDMEAQARLYPLFDLLTIEHPELKRGVLVTGDQFVASGSTRESLQAKGGQLVDMEWAAIAKVAHHYALPLVVLKIISDHANESAQHDFEMNLHVWEKVVEHLPFLLEFLTEHTTMRHEGIDSSRS